MGLKIVMSANIEYLILFDIELLKPYFELNINVCSLNKG